MPATVFDAFDSVTWALKNVGRFGVTQGIVVAGDRSGGNLSAVCALKCRDKGLALKAEVLVFPFTSFDVASRSSVEYGDSLFLTKKQGNWIGAQYLTRPENALNPLFFQILLAT